MRSRRASSRAAYREYLARRKREPAAVRVEADDERLKAKTKRSFGSLFRSFWGLLRGHRGSVYWALATLTVATLIGLAMPASTKFVVDYILTDKPGPAGIPEGLGLPRSREGLLWAVAWALIVAALAGTGIGMWGRWRATQVTKRLQAELRRRAFAHAVRLPLHRVQQIKSGGMASVLREDAGNTGELVFGMLYNPWRAVIQLVGTLAILTITDWRLLIGALALLPLVWATHKTWIARIRPVYRDIRHTRQSIDAQATEAFGGIRIVRGFGRERGESARFVGRNHYLIRQEMLAWLRSRAVDVAWQVLIPAASAGVLLYGGLRVLDGSLTIGDVMMFSAYLLMLLGPLETLAATATTIQTNLAALDRVLDLLGEDREFERVGGAGLGIERDRVRGRIALEAVSFTYPGGDKAALEGIDLVAEAGQTVALVGPSGAGKTTLCNLVARFFDPTEGRITLDGVDLRDLDPDAYRSLLGIVEQDVFLFDGTVRDNIAYARPDASEEDVLRAARLARADEFVREMEKGYGTLLGERGVRLSGGQRQRIAIARAVLADPKILILDEATSSLDTRSERLIQAGLDELMAGRTTFVIAHRLSTVRHADRIVVIAQGRVEEVGTHEELLASGGLYAGFLRAQVESGSKEDAPLPEALGS